MSSYHPTQSISPLSSQKVVPPHLHKQHQPDTILPFTQHNTPNNLTNHTSDHTSAHKEHKPKDVLSNSSTSYYTPNGSFPTEPTPVHTPEHIVSPITPEHPATSTTYASSDTSHNSHTSEYITPEHKEHIISPHTPNYTPDHTSAHKAEHSPDHKLMKASIAKASPKAASPAVLGAFELKLNSLKQNNEMYDKAKDLAFAIPPMFEQRKPNSAERKFLPVPHTTVE